MWQRSFIALGCATVLALALGQSRGQTKDPNSACPWSPPPAWGQRGDAGLSNEPFAPYNAMIYTGGFDPIFNRVNMDGWHASKTNFHGVTPNFFVTNRILVATQNPRGFGGILLSDRKFKNAEIYMEVKPDWGCDSGLFLRSAEDGSAYQVMLDYLPGGNMGGVIGERLVGVGGPRPADMTPAEREKRVAAMEKRNEAWQKVWKREDWNSVRVRIEGDVPHIQVWINDTLITDFRDTANHAKGGIVSGPIGLQVHGQNRWVDGGFWRWRVVAVKELPD
jgi:3-keto-disaccharide hydrolase